VRCAFPIDSDAIHSCDWARSEETNLLDDGIDRYLGINRRDERFLARRICQYLRQLALFSPNRYERPIAHSRGAVHPRVMEFCQERTAIENELSRVVNAVSALMWTAPFSAREHRNFARRATTVATASLIENWIDW
jgi:hypothetical protein